jgi:hypothetical protein
MLSFALACARAVVFGRTVDPWISRIVHEVLDRSSAVTTSPRLKIGGRTLYHTYTVYSVAFSVIKTRIVVR